MDAAGGYADRFLLTPLREGRRRCIFSRPLPTYFYSRPCGRGDRRLPEIMREMQRFLLTPLREGRLFPPRPFYSHIFISTHAPAGGATGTSACRRANAYFYSRPCGRGDLPGIMRAVSRKISTHAPAGGATLTRRIATADEDYFYSRPCGRGDLPSRRSRRN